MRRESASERAGEGVASAPPHPPTYAHQANNQLTTHVPLNGSAVPKAFLCPEAVLMRRCGRAGWRMTYFTPLPAAPLQATRFLASGARNGEVVLWSLPDLAHCRRSRRRAHAAEQQPPRRRRRRTRRTRERRRRRWRVRARALARARVWARRRRRATGGRRWPAWPTCCSQTTRSSARATTEASCARAPLAFDEEGEGKRALTSILLEYGHVIMARLSAHMRINKGPKEGSLGVRHRSLGAPVGAAPQRRRHGEDKTPISISVAECSQRKLRGVRWRKDTFTTINTITPV